MATHGRHEKPTARTDSAFFEPWSARQGQVPRNDAHLPDAARKYVASASGSVSMRRRSCRPGWNALMRSRGTENGI